MTCSDNNQSTPAITIRLPQDMSTPDSVLEMLKSANAAISLNPAQLTIDTLNVQEANSSFAAGLILIARRARAQCVPFRLENLNGIVKTLVEVLGIAPALAAAELRPANCP